MYVSIKHSYMFQFRRPILRKSQIQRRIPEDGVWAPKHVGILKILYSFLDLLYEFIGKCEWS
jgi:hypothetical protein